MKGAIALGLGATPTKVGHGEKEAGYKVKATSLQRFFLGVVGIGILLLAAVGAYQIVLSQEIGKGILNQRRAEIKHGKASTKAIRLGASLQSALQGQNKENDLVRTLKRVNNVVERQFDELSAVLQHSDANLAEEGKAKISGYIQSEIDDFVKEHAEEQKKNSVQLERIAKMQKKALRGILTSVYEGQVGALETMLNDLFEEVEEVPVVEIPPSMIVPIQELADSLFDESLTLDQGWARLSALESEYKTPINLDEEDGTPARKALTNAELLAEELDQLAEDAKISTGRPRLKALAAQWKSIKDQKKDGIEGKATSDDNDDADDDETDPTVEIMLQVQDLVNEGLVPPEWLQFDEMEADYYYDDPEGKGNGGSDDSNTPHS